MTAFSAKTIEQFKLAKALLQTATITAVGTTYFSLRPGYHTTIMINKATSIGTLKMTNDFNAVSVDTATFGEAQSTGADDYHKGHTAGFTGCEVDITTDNNDVEVRILQYLIGT